MTTVGSLYSIGVNWSSEAFASRQYTSELRVTAIHDPPYLSVHTAADGSLRYEGYLYDVWQAVAGQLGLRYRITPLLERGGYGSLDPNGSWSGMVGELVSGRADLALTMLYRSADRAAVIDYVDAVPVGRTSYTFLVRAGRPVAAGRLATLLSPLHADVWWTMLGFLLVLSLVFSALPAVTRRDVGRRGRVTGGPTTWGWSLFSSFSLLVGQGWPSTPSALSARTAIIFSWGLSIVMFNSYSATLMSHLTVTTDRGRPLHSLQEFHHTPGWSFAVDPSIGAMNQWKESSNPYESDLYRRSVTQQGFIAVNLTRASQWQVTQPRVMSYADRRKLSYFLGPAVCDLVPMLDEPLEEDDNYLVMSKGKDRLRWAINQQLRRLKEAGLLSRLERRWIHFSGGCDSGSGTGSGFKELSAWDLLALLLIMPVATVVSLVIAGIECLWAHHGPCRKQARSCTSPGWMPLEEADQLGENLVFKME